MSQRLPEDVSNTPDCQGMLYAKLEEINQRPAPFVCYTARELWTNPYTAQKMLEYHLHPTIDAASRNHSFIDRSARWIIDHFHLGSHSRVIDFGCGPGLYASRIAESGAHVTGVDFSANSIAYARREAERKNLVIRYIEGDYLTFETNERFDLITMIMCDFSALSPTQRLDLLLKFRRFLKPTGAVLFDIYSPVYFEGINQGVRYERNFMQHFWTPDDCHCFISTFKYPEDLLILDAHTIVEKTGTKVVYNWFQCFSEQSITQECEHAGLIVSERFADVAGSCYTAESSEFAVVARIA